MPIKINTSDFLISGNDKFSIEKAETKVKDFYDDKADYETQLANIVKEIDELQSMMYAHNRHALLVIFQAMDAAGKDGTIKAVFSGVNPAGLSFKSFKRPSETELEHDFMWRCTKEIPERGTIGVFNRSYYEEVLVVKVHPDIVKNYQFLPEIETSDLNKLWEKRYNDIKNLEQYLSNNGVTVIKFFLNISKKEQGEREIERILDPTKNWKFQEGDIKERVFWDDYMKAYETAINKTSTKNSPWYIIPADDKKNMRLIVAQTIAEKLSELKMSYPTTTPEKAQALKALIDVIKEQDKNL